MFLPQKGTQAPGTHYMGGSVEAIFPSTPRAMYQGMPGRAGKQITPQSLQKERRSADSLDFSPVRPVSDMCVVLSRYICGI